MQSVGIRELRQHASRWLRLVEAGATIEVTDRGRPVAWLVPPPADAGYPALVRAGRIRPATARLVDLGRPLPAQSGKRRLSDVLDDLRRDER